MNHFTDSRFYKRVLLPIAAGAYLGFLIAVVVLGLAGFSFLLYLIVGALFECTSLGTL